MHLILLAARYFLIIQKTVHSEDHFPIRWLDFKLDFTPLLFALTCIIRFIFEQIDKLCEQNVRRECREKRGRFIVCIDISDIWSCSKIHLLFIGVVNLTSAAVC